MFIRREKHTSLEVLTLSQSSSVRASRSSNLENFVQPYSNQHRIEPVRWRSSCRKRCTLAKTYCIANDNIQSTQSFHCLLNHSFDIRHHSTILSRFRTK